MDLNFNMEWDALGGQLLQPQISEVSPGFFHVRFCAQLPYETPQDLWQVTLRPKFPPVFWWAPHLAPEEGYCADQHSFRCPALIAKDASRVFMVLPDLECLKKAQNRWFLDLDAEKQELYLGISECEVPEHVLFRRKGGNVFPAGEFAFGFYVYESRAEADILNPFRFVLSFYWEKEGKPLFEAGAPAHAPLLQYCQRTYGWAFDSWKETVWQEFELNGTTVGAPAFIVNYTQSPNYPGLPTWRERLSVWNQAWFHSLRSASGLYRYACRSGNEPLKQKAMLTKKLALNMPQRPDGLFYSVIATGMESVDAAQGNVWRSTGWDTKFFGNSNRNPITGDIAASPFHLLDMSVTATWMLRWYKDLEQDEALLAYARRYADGLLKLQREDGFFPAWITQAGEQLSQLQISPETSASVTFLAELYALTGEKQYLHSALKAMNAVETEIIPHGRWEDFETYWSCCRWGEGYLGKKIPRSGMYKQCNFSMFWTAEALLALYDVTGEARYLQTGQRVLDELLMTQAVWQPPYLRVPVFGGFGVMNCDGEWLDARQSLFAETIIRYGMMLDSDEYIQRGIAALRASFVMMYCPENPGVKSQWEARWPFFGPDDYGFTMENYGHDGIIDEHYTGIGEFTIYDWGNGAASEGYMRISQKYGEILRRYGEM